MGYVNKVLNLGAAAGAVIDLRKAGATGAFNPVGYLKITALKGGAASVFYVKPVVVADGETAPSAPSASPAPAAGSSDDWLLLVSDGVAERELGVPFARGYDQAVYGAPVATHLLVWCLAAGYLDVNGQ